MGPFSAVVADPPWFFKDSLPGETRGAVKQYQCMSTHDICNMSLPPIYDNALLFLWRVSSMVREAYDVVHHWGFNPHSEIVWRKLTATGKEAFGMGRIVRGAHETCIIAKRGNPIIVSSSLRSIFSAKVGEHSEKPDAFYDIVEKITGTHTAKVELFARKQRPGWTCLGLESDGTDFRK